ncbi:MULTISPECIES: MBL fold metallo-hydrolase [unclassified Sphingobium]|uniref:MBL fold metallo-hydrolase n=1 Tax=unclassified Sphingobium TaxID=2611147 RepID=UPI00077007D3|nr:MULTISPECIES: MBL fold metallo-hydrolase [unclassified Sphingobium]AMK21117.1 metallo-beta-lactamase family protein [Sphingobium sp. TKS]
MAAEYSKGLRDLGSGSWAWLQPDGGWGFSNAGLIVDGGQSLLVDTLFDLASTAEMLAAMRDASPSAATIDILVNSHADADHTFGNQLVRGARIIASQETAREFTGLTPDKAQAMVENAEVLGEGAKYVAGFVRGNGFDFTGVEFTPPTETYDRRHALKVGDKDVLLYNVGPAHTAGDTLVHSVQDRVVFTADILFIGVHPAIWEGSIQGWSAACDHILSLDVDLVVPGHGPVTDKQGVRTFKRYIEILETETRKRFEAGMSVEQAAADIAFPPPYDDWLLPERLVGSVNFLYREWGNPDARTDFLEIFGLVAKMAADNPAVAACGCSDSNHQH